MSEEKKHFEWIWHKSYLTVLVLKKGKRSLEPGGREWEGALEIFLKSGPSC